MDSRKPIEANNLQAMEGNLKMQQILSKVKYTADSVDQLKDTMDQYYEYFKSRNDELEQKENKVEKEVKTIEAKQKEKPAASSDEEIANLQLDLDEITADKVTDKGLHDKWIVVTSIFAPTEDMKKLSKTKGWKMVVVGDKKTPKDWSLPGVVYLSIDTQEASGFETVKHLKYGVYQRKNMGFLYAVQHGAKYIYDTDDDNHPYGGKVDFDDLTTEKEYLVYHSDPARTYYNPMPHFGQSTIWPRGYPLNHIAIDPVRTYKKCKGVRPLVQQGVVDGDPDLDAIARLTRKDITVKFDVTFDSKAPPVILPEGSFTPYNTQNTIHHRDAFFSLLCPQTVTFRVNDIWRSYITQRLLWDIGGHLEYHTATAYQDRTPHDFLQDFIEEDDLYKKVLPFTKFLKEWKGTKETMEERYFEVIKELYKIKILGALDVHLARAWIRDMKRIGYTFPKMQKPTMKCEEKVVEFFPIEQGSMYLRAKKTTVDVLKAAADKNAATEKKDE